MQIGSPRVSEGSPVMIATHHPETVLAALEAAVSCVNAAHRSEIQYMIDRINKIYPEGYPFPPEWWIIKFFPNRETG